MKRDIKIVLLLVGLFISGGVIWPVQLKILDTIQNIVTAKKITVKFKFEPDDSVIYSDSIRFSLDAAEVKLKNWRSLTPPILEYIPLLRQDKHVFIDSFDAEVLLDFDVAEKLHLPTLLRQTNLHLACLTLSKNNKNRPKNLIVSLYKKSFASASITNETAASNVKTRFKPGNNAKIRHSIDNDDAIFEQLFTYCSHVLNKIYEFFESESFLMSYLGLLFLLIVLGVLYCLPTMRYLFTSSEWMQEGVQFLFLLWVGFSLSFFKLFLSYYLVLLIFAIFALIVGMYYLHKGNTGSNFLARCNIVLGMILVALVLPLLVKAFLMKNNFL